MADQDENPYATIRSMLGSFIGKRVADITQHDEDDFVSNPDNCCIMFMFEDGTFVKCFSPAGRSVEYNDGKDEDDE